MSELEVMKKLKPHPHVIKLMGCVTESGNNIYIIMLRDGFNLRACGKGLRYIC